MIPEILSPKGGIMEKYYLGIDVSKGYSDFVILDEKKQQAEANFQLDDTSIGHSQLYTRLVLFFENHPDSIIYSAVESTGGYENNWLNSLLSYGDLNIKAARLNPLGVSANGKAALNRITTDKISARNVAEYLISHPEKVMYQQQDMTETLRKQWAFIKTLTKQGVQLLNQLESYLYIANPELLFYCKGETPMWVLKLVEKYPTAPQLAKARAKTVGNIPYVTRGRAEQIIKSAKNSVASSTDSHIEHLIKETSTQIIFLRNKIKAEINYLTEHCSLPQVELLKTFPGIGDFSAIGLILEIQTIDRFSSAKKLASFFGLHPIYKTSGDGSSRVKMSKKGRREPRRILFMVTLSALNSNPLIEQIYRKHVEKGMQKKAAIGVCMHKILRIIYGMLKNNTAFDPEIDRKNSNKKPVKVGKDKNRRYQNYDDKAPISRRQHVKRKKTEKAESIPIVQSETNSEGAT